MPNTYDIDRFTRLNDREIAGTGLGTSPASVAAYSDLQRAVYEALPSDTADAAAAAAAAAAQADTANSAAADAAMAASNAGTAASGAQSSADTAQARADSAYTRADAAYAVAGTKITKNVGPSWAGPVATPSRLALPAYTGGTAGAIYTAADMQAVMDQVAALTSRLAAVIADGRGNGALTP